MAVATCSVYQASRRLGRTDRTFGWIGGWTFASLFLIAAVACATAGGDSFPVKVECDDESNLQALKELHEKLDDDHDGEVELTETSEFVRNEFSSSSNGRYKKFHANDSNINLEEMTDRWKTNNPAYNWTTPEMVYWLQEVVGLPEYDETFKKHNLIGKCLPRIALNEEKFLQKVLLITKRTDKSRLKLKAMEIILFGPAFPSHFWQYVGMIVLTSIAMILGGFGWRAHSQNQRMAEMLTESHSRLKEARTLQDSFKGSDDEFPDTASVAPSSIPSENSLGGEDGEQVEELKTQVDGLRLFVKSLTRQLETKDMYMSHALLMLLCDTYNRETRYYHQSRKDADHRLRDTETAYLNCEKKIRSSIIPSSIKARKILEELDKSILEAKAALGGVQVDSQERQIRWSRMEKVCGFRITDPKEQRKLRSAGSGTVYRVKGSSHGGTSPRIHRGTVKSSTFSGQDTHWEDPPQVRRSTSTQDQYLPSGLTSSSSNSSLRSNAVHQRSISPARKPAVQHSASSHSLERQPEVDEVDTLSRRRSEETEVRQRSTETTPKRRLTGEVESPPAKLGMVSNSMPVISSSSRNRSRVDPSQHSHGAPVRFTAGDDGQPPESDV